MGQKKAVLIGLNYPDTENQLSGCINDVIEMYDCLVSRFGFKADDITCLVDTDPKYTMPTGANIWEALNNLVLNSVSGDTLYIHYSGHGTRFPAQEGDNDETGYDECIVPSDGNLITDDDFRVLACKVPDGCRLTIVSDSCHSGGLLGDAIEQIGESTKIQPNQDCQTNDVDETGNQDKQQRGVKSRSLSIPGLIQMLKHKTGNKDIEIGNIRSTLFNAFGDNASPTVKKSINTLQQKMKGKATKNETEVAVENLAVELETQTLDQNHVIGISKHEVPRNGVLLSGCQTYQTSADANRGDFPFGAFTHAILEVLAKKDGEVSNAELVFGTRELLPEEGFTQLPGLYCNDDFVNAPFIC